MIKFSIFIPTYDRQELVAQTLNSLMAQTYSNFEILLYDNGSQPSVANIVELHHDKRIRYKRFEKNLNVNDLAEDALNRMSGDYFLFLADDDVLVPKALAIVAEVGGKHEAGVIQTGFTNFNHTHRTLDLGPEALSSFSGKVEPYDSLAAANHFFNGWGIGPKKKYIAPPMAHSSGIFIAKQVIDQTRARQGELFIKPFGDIGYVGAILNTDKYYFVDQPLAVVGEAQVREMNGAKPGQRQKWEKEVVYLEHSPLKGVSFVNMGTDAHLKVLYRNRHNARYDCRLRPNFYFRHLKQVVSDSPWTMKTVRDIAEAIPYLLISLFGAIISFPFGSIKNSRRIFAARLKNGAENIKRTLTKNNPPIVQSKTFMDINEYAKWVDNNYVKYKTE